MRSTVRRNRDGSEVRYLQLAENVWDKQKGCAVAKVVYNFGRADQVDEVAAMVDELVSRYPEAAGYRPGAIL